ncbi:aryl-sulfate sulfotransferase [Lacinutrix iliipiscaria]|uniref:Aryl-sulfate sulfotransferase n=1 Tax=Lacinutrix iliipiscaria TaxID=1230532 RepID=A0ABW5WPF0_9FLAO
MKKLLLLLNFFFCLTLLSQNTVGTIRNDSGSYNGYTLLYPANSTETYLINNCGEVIHQWTSTYTPAASAYLLENGNLLRTGKISNSDITFGGVGGKIELFDWNNTLLWEYTYSSATVSQHHDIFPLPNGNILMLAVSTMTEAEAIQAGRDPFMLSEGKLFNEQILELEPVGMNQANVVWEWNIKNHLIQDIDASKDNFGVVAENPQLLDINYLNDANPIANWLHINSIQYNETLDQIVLSSRILSEIYIIDHSTTTEQAATNSGGIYGKGGDFLYRWGNPEAYGKGTSTDRTLFSQHYPHWIPDGFTDAGKIILFNNGNSRAYSSVDIINPPVSAPGVYIYDETTGYGPTAAEWIYTDPEPTDLFSSILSSGERLPNGNTLICDGDSGYFFEIDTNNTIVWEYVNPDAASGILTQGDTPTANLTFRAKKFSEDYPAFFGRDLTPGDPIELNPDLSECTILSTPEFVFDELIIHPNPSSHILNIKTNNTIDKIELYDLVGHLVLSVKANKQIDISHLSNGLYLTRIISGNHSITKKIIKN